MRSLTGLPCASRSTRASGSKGSPIGLASKPAHKLVRTFRFHQVDLKLQSVTIWSKRRTFASVSGSPVQLQAGFRFATSFALKFACRYRVAAVR